MHTLEAPGYALIGVQAGMKLPQGVSVYLDARNLANVHYVRIPTQAGRGYRFEAGQGSDLMPATIPR
jgi:iron complex outermembrane receptor protein